MGRRGRKEIYTIERCEEEKRREEKRRNYLDSLDELLNFVFVDFDRIGS
jgi:hypothetical protein